MQSKKSGWYAIFSVSLGSILLLGTGAVMAYSSTTGTVVQKQPSSPPQPQTNLPNTQTPPTGQPKQPTTPVTKSPVTSPAAVNGDYRLLALGDSLTRGTGDETGLGYVGNVTTELQKLTKNKIIVSNLGVNGMKSPELLQYVNSPEVQQDIRSANLITITIGGNDLSQGVGSVTSPDPQVAKKTRDTYLASLDQTVATIRSLNPNSAILFIGLYNPFLLQGSAAETATQILQDWNQQTVHALGKYPNTLFVPTEDLFAWDGTRLLSADMFHPNAKGYKWIADRILQDIL
ncbi:GDSL-type esterase/lipase family protein [Effusibacillus dendaii]|uniref:SGNH hydrolase-type esterase domain-containing protein n=1 Tax=Effusibacillus dendaii TaxID=2743772 RepID=A0A7I8DJL8_9BACL|nr:GDSL-type esterase/lipase family protein [Effusibacillus dendaii]BCJ88051.1 hypothetical protein skT53_30360 [Effusibacillus dendaii]